MFWWLLLGIGALLATPLVIFYVERLTLSKIKETIKEYLTLTQIIYEANREHSMKKLAATIEACYKNGDYNEVRIGLRNSKNETIDKIIIRSEEIDENLHEGQVISLAEVS